MDGKRIRQQRSQSRVSAGDMFAKSVRRPLHVQRQLVAKCAGKVEIRPIVGGDMMLQPFFLKHLQPKNLKGSNAKIIHTQGLYFGNNPELTDKEINEIIHIFTD